MTGRLAKLRDTLGPAVRAQRSAVLAALGLIGLGAILVACGTPLWWFGASSWVGALLCLYGAFGPQWRALHTWLGHERSLRGRTFVPSVVLLDLLYGALLVWVDRFATCWGC